MDVQVIGEDKERLWDNVFDHLWFCKVDRLDANNGLLVVCSLPRAWPFECPRGLVMRVCLPYGGMHDCYDVERWKRIVIDFVDQKGMFTIQ